MNIKNLSIEEKNIPNSFSPIALVEILGISKSSAYQLASTKEFPSFKIGKRVVIGREPFVKWLQKQYCNEV